MDVLNKDYIHQLIEHSKQSLNQKYNFHEHNFSNFGTVNSFLIDKVLNNDRTNLLITIPKEVKDRLNDFLLPVILTTTLHCQRKNINEKATFELDDILLSKQEGKLSIVREVNETKVRILPLGTYKKVDLDNEENYICISKKFSSISEKLEFKIKKKYENLSKKLLAKFEAYKGIIGYFNSRDIQLPSKNKNKVIIIASKNEVVYKIPKSIPYQCVNKSGEVYPDTSIDPLLIVVSDFKTVKEYFIEKSMPVDTIAFIGDSKYQQFISSISKAYRQQKFNHCIFIGTKDIETGENFEVLKWNWTLPEIKFFYNQQYQNITSEIIKNTELSEAIKKFSNFIEQTEKRYENLINLKQLLKFIRRIYPITAIGNENRIRERANEIYANFENEAEEIFQEEYYNIDADYKKDLEELMLLAQDIINLIKNKNAKDNWLKQAKDIDYIVVPKPIKDYSEKEIKNAIINTQKQVQTNSLENIKEIFIERKNEFNGDYSGLKNTKIITVSEFFKKNNDNKTHLFLSLYSNGIFPETLLKKILSSNHKTKILCYIEEAQIIRSYLDGFQKENEKELRSLHREQLCNIKYPETPYINSENIDEWIKHLIELDEQKSIKDEKQFEIVFENGDKIKERESRNVYVEDYDELYKEIHELKPGDKVRIYRNPDKEILHDLVKLTDEELFNKVNYFSELWKNSLS